MSELAKRVRERKEQIRWRLHRLDQRREELSRKMEGLKAYVAHLEELQHEVRRATSENHLKKIIGNCELETRIKPTLFKLSRYFIEKEVEQKLKGAKRELEEAIREIEAIERMKKNGNICPDCHGQGQLREVSYVREDRLVHPVLHVTRCPICRGKGRIDYLDLQGDQIGDLEGFKYPVLEKQR